MFTLSDGREHLYQWDLDRQVAVQDPSITEVHFCNRTDECSLVTKVVNGLADIPNILLQSSFDIRVFGYDGKATRFDKVFKVKARTRPADYIYTETDVKNYSDLEARVKKLEENGTGPSVGGSAGAYFLDINEISWEGLGNSVGVLTEDLLEFADKVAAGEAVSIYLKHKDDIASLPALYWLDDSNKIFIESVPEWNYVGKSYTSQRYVIQKNSSDTWVLKKYSPATAYFIPDKTYVDNALASSKAYTDEKLEGIGGGAETLYVNFSMIDDQSTLEADKSLEEVIQAFSDGRSVYGIVEEEASHLVMPLEVIAEGTAMFSVTLNDTCLTVIMSAEGIQFITFNYVRQEDYIGHTTDFKNPHNVTKAQLGLAHVDDTPDAIKPVSKAQQQAIDNALAEAKNYADEKITTALGVIENGTY